MRGGLLEHFRTSDPVVVQLLHFLFDFLECVVKFFALAFMAFYIKIVGVFLPFTTIKSQQRTTYSRFHAVVVPTFIMFSLVVSFFLCVFGGVFYVYFRFFFWTGQGSYDGPFFSILKIGLISLVFLSFSVFGYSHYYDLEGRTQTRRRSGRNLKRKFEIYLDDYGECIEIVLSCGIRHSIINLFLLFSWIVSCVSIVLNPVRFYFYLGANFNERDFVKCVYRNFLNTLLDYLTLPFIIIQFLTLYRIPLVVRPLLRRQFNTFSHGYFVLHGLMGILDFVIITPTVIIVVLTGYRASSFFRKFCAARLDQRYVICVKALLDLLIDIPFLAMLLVCISTLHCIRILRQRRISRWIIFQQFSKLVLNILCVPCVFFAVLSVIRVKEVLSILRGVGVQQFDDAEEETAMWKHAMDKRHCLIGAGLLGIRDVFVFFTFGSPVLLFVYRVPILIRKWKSTENVDKKHEVVFEQFQLLMTDLPFILLALCSLYRLVPILRFLVVEKDAWKRRKKCVQQFLYMLQDGPAAACMVVLVLTFYRFLRAKRKLLQYKERSFPWHCVIFYEFMGLLIDIPFLFVGILCLWRVPYLLYLGVFSKKTSIYRMRYYSFREFKEMITDVLFVVCSIVMILSVFHIQTLFIAYYRARDVEPSKTLNRRFKRFSIFKKRMVFLFLRKFPFSIVHALLSIFLLFSWRVQFVIRLLKTIVKKKYFFPKVYDMLKRIVVFNFCALFLDIFAMASFVWLQCTYFRAEDARLVLFSKEESFFTYSEEKKFLETVPKQMKMLKILRQFHVGHLKKTVLFVLSMISSITVWKTRSVYRFVYVEERAFNEKFKFLLSAAALTLLEPFCFALSMSLLCTWRCSLVITGISKFDWKSEGWRVFDIHMFILNEFLQSIIDIPYVIALLILVLTNYRVVYIVEFWRRGEKEEEDKNKKSWRRFIAFETGQLCRDLPLIVFASLGCVVSLGFRVPLFMIALYRTRDNKKRRYFLNKIIANTLVDLTSLILMILLLFFPWRFVNVLRRCYREKKQLLEVRFRSILFQEVREGVLDLRTFCESVVVFYLVFRVFTMTRRIYNVVSHHVREFWRKRSELMELRKRQKVDLSEIAEGNGQVIWGEDEISFLLPYELFGVIFSFSNTADLLRIEQVCKFWKKVSCTDLVWKYEHSKTFPGQIPSTTNNNKADGVYARTFRNAFGDHYKRSVCSHLKHVHLERVRRRRRSGKRRLDHEIGLRKCIREEFCVSFGRIYGYVLFQLKVLGVLMIPIHYFNEFTNSYAKYIYLRVFKRLPPSRIRTIPKVFYRKYFKWQKLELFFLHSLWFFLGVVVFYAFVVVDFSIFLFFCVLFLASPLWYRRNRSRTVDIIIDAIQIISILFVCVFFLNYLTPFMVYFLRIFRWLFSIEKTPFDDIDVRVTVLSFIHSHVSIRPIHLTVLVSEWPFVLFFHKLVIRTELWVIQVIVNQIIVKSLTVKSWISSIVFPCLWIAFFEYCRYYFALLYIKRFFPFYQPMKCLQKFSKWLVRTYIKLLTLPAEICAKASFVGEIVIIPIAFAWVFWPVIVFYFSLRPLFGISWEYFVPVLLFCLYQLFVAPNLVKRAWKKSRNNRE